MQIAFRIASPEETHLVQRFLAEHFRPDAETPPEFRCSDGAAAAVRRGEMALGTRDGEMVFAMRFYRRKRGGRISVYQVAAAPGFPLEDLRDAAISWAASSPR